MTIALNQPHELTWGDLVLSSATETDLPFRFEALVGTAFGNPVPLVEVVRSYLDDGDLAVRTGWGNREDIPVFVRVSALDGESLGQGEAALASEFMADRHSPLVWTPPALGARPMAFDVITVTPERDWPVDASSWDHREKYTSTRVYKLEFTTRPFTRDLETTVIPALDVPTDPEGDPVIEPVNACTSTAGWVRKVSPTTGEWYGLTGPTIVSGGVRATGNLVPGAGYGWMALELTQAVAMTGTPYLIVDVEKYASGGASWEGDDGTQVSLRFDAGTDDDLIADPVAIAPTADPNVDRYYFDAPASFSKVLLRLRVTRISSQRSVLLRAVDISRTDRLGIDGTAGFQVARTAIIEGTAPTGATVRIDAGASPLIGSIAMIYTGKTPVVPLRPLTVDSAPATPSTARISGATNDLSEPMVILVPITQLAESTYTILALLNFTGTATIDWQARLVAADGSDIPGSDLVVEGTVLIRNDTTDPWRIHALAAPRLPVIVTEGETTDKVELTLSMATGGSAVDIDEAWLADTDNGAVTLIHEPSAFQLTAIELRSPQLDAPKPSVFGTWSGGRVQDITRLARLGTHRFEPGLLHIFTATDLARFAPCSLEYYRRYFLHPAAALATDTPEV